jgi:hypothetical protein
MNATTVTENKNKFVKMTVKLDTATHKKVKLKLIEENTTFQELMVTLIEKFIEKE